MADANVTAVIKARDEATGVITRTRQKIEGQLKGFERSFTELQSKMSFMGQAGRVAFDAVNAALKIARGDLEGMQQIVESLPLGIGEIARAMRMLGEEISGAAAEMREFKRINDKTKVKQAEKDRQAADRKLIMSEIERMRFNFLPKEEQQAARDEALRKRVFSIEKELNKSGTMQDKLVWADLVSDLFKWHDRQKELLQQQKMDREMDRTSSAAERARLKPLAGTLGTALPGLIATGFRMFGDQRQSQIQASPLAPVVEGSRLTGRTAAARAERQSEFVRRQAEQQAQQTKLQEQGNKSLADLVQLVKGKPTLNVMGIGN